jgi:DNA-binding transcriptional ArsR family regulator
VSELRDLVLGAIDGGACDRDAIIAETGLEHRQVTNLLFNLRSAGVIEKDEEGAYSRADGAPPPNGRVHKAVEPADEEPERVPQKRAKKRNYDRKTNGAAVPAIVPAAEQVAPVSFSRFGEYVVLRTSDLKDLAELVERLERWRPIVDLARTR